MTDRELMQQALEALENRDGTLFRDEIKAMDALRERLAQPEQKRPQNCGTSYCSCIECVMEPERPEQSPLDRMAENARELGLDYEPVQEPVALETVYETIIHWDEGGGKRSRRELARRIVALYTTPPRRQWRGLTEEEIVVMYGGDLDYRDGDYLRYARTIEAKLREKNA